MRTSSTSGFEWPGIDLRGAIDGLRHAVGAGIDGLKTESARDIRSAVLVELAVQPMHGYQVIQAIQERTRGAWTPSPGSVYPTLQLLVDEGLATVTQEGERKVYTLTGTGLAAAAAAADGAGAQHPSDTRRGWDERAALPKSGMKLAQALSQVAQHGGPDQQERAAAIVDEARRKLYAILAEE